jgi:fibrillarin-like rRNA methylase
MAHFAKLGTGNIVERVEVVSNDIATTEQAGVDFLNNLIWNKRCLETNFL